MTAVLPRSLRDRDAIVASAWGQESGLTIVLTC
jgi:hypothetical protein